MAVATLKYISEEEYLALEVNAEYKHEYLAGQIFDMAGGTPEHALVISNATAGLHRMVTDLPCRIYSSDLRIRVEATGLNTYPDVTMVCGELRTTDKSPKAAINPTLIVEVLSDSTREYDRGEKWRHYQKIDSLTDYVLIWQDRPRVEHYTRQSGDSWTYRLVEGVERAVRIERIAADLSLAGLYRGVDFPDIPVLRNTDPSSESSVNGNT